MSLFGISGFVDSVEERNDVAPRMCIAEGVLSSKLEDLVLSRFLGIECRLITENIKCKFIVRIYASKRT